MTRRVQNQIGGRGNIQVSQEIAIPLDTLLNDAADNLKERTFACADVKKKYIGNVTEITKWINQSRDDILKSTEYIMYPFRTLPEETSFQNADFIGALLETITLMTFSGIKFAFVDGHLNLRIEENQTSGLYYHSAGSNDLIDCFIRLIKCLKKTDAVLPNRMIFIILRCVGGESYLEAAQIKNILDASDIAGNDPYIKPLQNGTPKCVNLTGYMMKNCATLQEAEELVKGVMSHA